MFSAQEKVSEVDMRLKRVCLDDSELKHASVNYSILKHLEQRNQRYLLKNDKAKAGEYSVENLEFDTLIDATKSSDFTVLQTNNLDKARESRSAFSFKEQK